MSKDHPVPNAGGIGCIGCIDPHGRYPFPVSRAVCPKCQAIRARMTPRHRGLPYGWWKNPDLWAFLVAGIVLPIIAVLLLLAWFR